jgi:predicted DNA-binding ribbon-helix-helix protein
MPKKAVSISILPEYHAKLKAIAQSKNKTMTRLVEEWIDRLKLPSAVKPQTGNIDGLVRVCVNRLNNADNWEDVEKITSRWDAEFKAKAWDQLGEEGRIRIQGLKEQEF